MAMREFARILETAVLHKGSREAVESNLPLVKNAQQLTDAPDSFYLSTMTRRIFQAGLKHSMVDDRWPNFEQAFYQFDVNRLAMMSDDELDAHMTNSDLIRHLGKMKSIRLNAAMILATSREHGGFGRFIAEWPESDIIGLWQWLKKHGNQMGGMSGSRFLRLAGKDTFLLTNDVNAVLKSMDIIDKPPTAKRDLVRVQEAFNVWREQSGRPLAEISRIMSFTVNS